MNKAIWTIAVLAVGLIFSGSALAKNYNVKMLNKGPQGVFQFDPDYLHIKPGATVTFVPTDAGHNSQSVFIPKGAKPWRGRIGHTIKVTLTHQGVYIYECEVHHMFDMVGVIQVGKAVNKKAAEAEAHKLAGHMIMNKKRILKLMNEVT